MHARILFHMPSQHFCFFSSFFISFWIVSVCFDVWNMIRNSQIQRRMLKSTLWKRTTLYSHFTCCRYDFILSSWSNSEKRTILVWFLPNSPTYKIQLISRSLSTFLFIRTDTRTQTQTQSATATCLQQISASHSFCFHFHRILFLLL